MIQVCEAKVPDDLLYVNKEVGAVKKYFDVNKLSIRKPKFQRQELNCDPVV